MDAESVINRQPTKLPYWHDHSSGYGVYLLPHNSPNIDIYTKKYRDFRISQLADSSAPFSHTSSPDIETHKPLSFFRAKLTDPRRLLVVATHLLPSDNRGSRDSGRRRLDPRPTSASTAEQEHMLLAGEWVCVLHAIGPYLLDQWRWPNCGLKSDEEEARWHLCGMYTVPKHRGVKPEISRIAAIVLRQHCALRALEMIGANAGTAQRDSVQVRLRCCVVAANKGVIDVYTRKRGWSLAGYTTQDEAARASENNYEIPASGNHVADTAVMEVVCKVHLAGSWYQVDASKI